MSFNHLGQKEIIGGTLKKCPKCHSTYNGYSAISRDDNKTEICSSCGIREAMQDFLKSQKLEVD